MNTRKRLAAQICNKCSAEMVVQPRHRRWYCFSCRNTILLQGSSKDPVIVNRSASRRKDARANREFTILSMAIYESINMGKPLPKEFNHYPAPLLESIYREKVRAKQLENNIAYWRESPEECSDCEKCNRQAFRSAKGGFYCCHCRHTTLVSSDTKKVLEYYQHAKNKTHSWPLYRDACVDLHLTKGRLKKILEQLRLSGHL